LGKKIKTQNSNTFWDRYDQYISERIVGQNSTIDSARTLIKILKKFKPDLTLEGFKIQFITEFHKYLIDVRHCSENTASTQLARIKSFIKYSYVRGWIDNNPFLKYKINAQVYGKPVYLTLEERDKIFNAKIEIKKFELLRDILIFQSLIGCRICDLRKLTTLNIVGNNLEYIATKTKDENPRSAVIPLTKKALSIINKYNLPNGKLLPEYSKCEINVDLKFLLDSLGIHRIVTIPDGNTRMGKQVRICDIASTYMARRIFIGGLYKKGVKDAIIASMSGHVKDSKAFGRYYDVDNDERQAAISLIE